MSALFHSSDVPATALHWVGLDQDEGFYVPASDCPVCRAEQAERLMPCGHPALCVSTSDEGTSYCRWCNDIAALAEARRALGGVK